MPRIVKLLYLKKLYDRLVSIFRSQSSFFSLLPVYDFAPRVTESAFVFVQTFIRRVLRYSVLTETSS